MRPIDADTLREFLVRAGRFLKIQDDKRTASHAIGKIIEHIDNMPTIDAEPVRHGHWIEANDGTHYCSNCGHDAPFTWDDIDRNFMHSADEVPDFTANYCYCCGAKMGEVSE